MALKSSDTRWGSIAQWLHWLMALAIIGNGILGLIMVDMSRGMTKLNVFAIHKSIGLTVLALLILRVCWRMLDRKPRDEPMPRWQRLAAHATHAVLYLFMLAIPLSGWTYNSAHGNPLQWFKLFNLPALMERNDAISDLARDTHEVLFWILLLILVAHVGGALVHHVFTRDNTLLRMLPFARLRSRNSGDQS
ncbi:MAG TPA: cytochrome b [Dokdonella sp.]|uniref:cytochrome b n=1 Tax=Dokdonella sp. TaxID=2291710 RepID=UPI002D804B3A|nr:cytochrome b [Dokdonella sp.]HET9031905.1 cytochrome b [Dokdonella sp.]